MPPLPLSENPDIELVEAVTEDMIDRLARLLPDLRQEGMTGRTRREIHRYAEWLAHFSAENMPVRQP